MAETIEDTRRRRTAERRALTGAGARDIAKQQENALRQGYSRGTEPSAPARQIGPQAPRPMAPAGGLESGVISSAEQERRRRMKAAAGIPLTQEDLQ
jgi:hypothetical protein